MIFLDTNILVDVLSAREGYDTSAEVVESIRAGRETGCISALTIPIVWYVLGERRESIGEIDTLVKHFSVVPLDLQILKTSFKSSMGDFEDSIQLNSALKKKCSTLITRNKRDFKTDRITVLTPEEFLEGRKN